MEQEQMSSNSKKNKIGLESKKSETKIASEADAKKENGKRGRSRSKDSVDNSKVIRLLGNRSVYHVSVEDFASVSQLVKKQQTAGKPMPSADLQRFSDQSILAFVNYVQNKEIKSALTYYAITELVTLAHTFQMKDLQSFLEDGIVEAAKSSEADLLQTIIISDVVQLDTDIEKTLQTLASDQIEKLVSLPDFHKIPSFQLYQILSSCELVVSHEMFVADVVLLWLSGQNHVKAFAPSLLSCIRTKFLSPVDRTLIIERLNQLNLSSKLVRLAINMLGSTNSQRVCLDPIHVKKNFPRCGLNVNPAHFNPHSSLPLSRPNFNMKMKKTKEGKQRPTFDPSSVPKVIDLINTDPKSARSERSTKGTKKNGTGVKKTEKIPTKPPLKAGSKKSRCACLDYVKSKMSGKNKPKRPAFQDPNALKVKPPGANKNTASSSKTSASSKLSSSTKSKSNANKKEKNLEKRRARKRNKIQNAIKTSKSQTENSSKSKGKSQSIK